MILAAACLLAAPVMAEERTTSPPFVMSGGIICDTLEQAREFATNWRTVGFNGVDGCGVLRGRVLGTVTMMDPLETRTHTYPMARYDFLAGPLNGQTQYGWFGRPTVKSAAVEVEA